MIHHSMIIERERREETDNVHIHNVILLNKIFNTQ